MIDGADELHVLRNPHGFSEDVVRAARLWAGDEIERLSKDAARYRFLRNTFFTYDFAIPEDFTGDVIIAPPRTETFEHGIPITKDQAHGEHLDATIDAALDGTTAALYKPIVRAP
jgi:hypothetical protein